MHDTKDLLNSMKKAGMQAVEASKPVNVLFGKVISISPLKINVEQKMTLGKAQLILTRNVTDYKVAMDVDFNIETTSLNANHNHSVSGNITVNSTISPNNDNTKIENTVKNNMNIQTQDINISHTHKYNGLKTYTVHNCLVVGDEVVLLRMQGGQKYIVLDRVAT